MDAIFCSSALLYLRMFVYWVCFFGGFLLGYSCLYQVSEVLAGSFGDLCVCVPVTVAHEFQVSCCNT